MEYFLLFFKFAINSFGTTFLFLMCTIIIIDIIYFLLYLYFESNDRIRYKKKKGNIKNLILKIKSKKYGLKTEVFKSILEAKAP